MQSVILKTMRKTLGVNQTELGKLIGYSQQTLSNMESGKVPVPKGVLLAVEALLYRSERGEPLDAVTKMPAATD